MHCYMLFVLLHLPNNADKIFHVLKGLDVAGFTGINRADGNPVQSKTTADTGDNHLDFIFEALFVAGEHGLHEAADQAVARLVVGNGLAQGPGEGQTTEPVGQAAQGGICLKSRWPMIRSARRS